MQTDNITHSSTNALKESIRLLLETSSDYYTEYDIIRYLNDQGWALSLDATDSTVLFKSHFLVYHALYSLQVEYWQQAEHLLEISALKIGFVVPSKASSDAPSDTRVLMSGNDLPPDYASHQALRDYYLDLSQLEAATEASVNDLLNQFWTRMIVSNDKIEALAIFELPATASLGEIKQRYRNLAMAHHPDRGGNAEVFQRINWALGVLQQAV